MGEHPLAQDLIATVQRRPLLAMLREWRHGAGTSLEAGVLTDLIREIESGALDG